MVDGTNIGWDDKHPKEDSAQTTYTIAAKHAAMVAHLTKSGQIILDNLTPVKVDMIHMSIGIAGEAGEILDAIKKHVIYGKPLDLENCIEELGDIEFYLEGFRAAIGVNRNATLYNNYEKLMKKRYPNGYTDEAAIARADKVPQAGDHPMLPTLQNKIVPGSQEWQDAQDSMRAENNHRRSL